MSNTIDGNRGLVWVFDLDGTLWKENSHIHIVETYLKWKKYTNLLAKTWCKFRFESYMHSLNDDYSRLPKNFINTFKPNIQTKPVILLERAKRNMENAIIISNAPNEIVTFAGDLFGIEAYHADIGKKAFIFNQINNAHSEAIVVTDNLSDKDLIELSKKTYFFYEKKHKKRVMRELGIYKDKINFVKKDKC